jgi:hypothetical protein
VLVLFVPINRNLFGGYLSAPLVVGLALPRTLTKPGKKTHVSKAVY